MFWRKLRWDKDTPATVTLFVWIRTIPFVIVLGMLFFGWQVAWETAAVLMIVILALCRLRCFVAARHSEVLNKK